MKYPFGRHKRQYVIAPEEKKDPIEVFKVGAPDDSNMTWSDLHPYTKVLSEELAKFRFSHSYYSRLFTQDRFVNGHYIVIDKSVTNMLGVTWRRPEIFATIESEPWSARRFMTELEGHEKLKYEGLQVMFSDLDHIQWAFDRMKIALDNVGNRIKQPVTIKRKIK